jgi:hypothetical protein
VLKRRGTPQMYRFSCECYLLRIIENKDNKRGAMPLFRRFCRLERYEMKKIESFSPKKNMGIPMGHQILMATGALLL